MLSGLFFREVTYGATTQIIAATTPDASKFNGKVGVPPPATRGRRSAAGLTVFFPLSLVSHSPDAEYEPSPASSDAALAKKLWEWCEGELAAF